MLAACRYEIVLLVRSLVRLLLWSAVLCIGLVTVFVLLPQAWTALPSQLRQFLDVQTSVALGLIAVSLFAIGALAKSQLPDRRTWIGTHAGVVAAGAAAVFWLPQWSPYIVATALVLFVFAPNILYGLAQRRYATGYPQAAAFYARLAWPLHPSRHMRFELSFLAAQTLGSIEERVAAYRALASHATPQQAEILNCRISEDQDDWERVLAQLRGAGDKPSVLKPSEIRALGELGRVDDMIAAYACVESVLSPYNLLVGGLFVLAFSGRTEAVRSLLSGQLRSLSPQRKALWIFIAGRAAGTDDEEARRVLVSCARAADDETFRRRAHRHLNAAAAPGGSALSAQSLATIAAIEERLRKTKGSY